jgi:phosphate transport system protein
MKKPHIDHALGEELAQVRALLEAMAKEAEGMFADSLHALDRRDGEQAKRVIAEDQRMNGLEVAIDEHCLRLLARWHPAASDLRFIAAALKVVIDLERIGDHCVNICERVLELSHDGQGTAPVDLTVLAASVESMLREAFAALAAEDVQQAVHVIERGKEIDALVRDVLHGCFDSMRQDGASLHLTVRTHEIAGYLQRIAAHGTNIAEMVVFLVRGEDVRHPGRLRPAAIPGNATADDGTN